MCWRQYTKFGLEKMKGPFLRKPNRGHLPSQAVNLPDCLSMQTLNCSSKVTEFRAAVRLMKAQKPIKGIQGCLSLGSSSVTLSSSDWAPVSSD